MWRCLMCQREFSQKHNGVRHFKLVHCTNEKQQCKYCFVWSKNKISLDQHIRDAHRKGLSQSQSYTNRYQQQQEYIFFDSDLVCHNKSESNLFLFTRNFKNECLKPVFKVQNHLFNLCSKAVNSQVISQNAGVNVRIKAY